MFLLANDIQAEIKSGKIVIEPFLPELLKPASYVLRLGTGAIKWIKRKKPLKVWGPDASKDNLKKSEPEKEIIVRPYSLVLMPTLEKIKLPEDIVGFISTLSHMARFGITMQSNASIVSPGFGYKTPSALTLELFSVNPSPLKLKVGIPSCHLAFIRTSSNFKKKVKLSHSIYEGLEVPHAPMLFEEFSPLLNLE
jgi:dCTP deaminase